ncbi:MAG: hypothetical protein OEX23_15450 [Betaproteobacteria bacterium]|jgi:vacuolar-type H+-ATPase subunit F/Vma7|nr:hypothetical protein [Betaproteobacteria bacterium]
MRPPCYVGDEATAAGFRLAGCDALVPVPGREREALDAARAQAPLVLLCAGTAARLPAAVLRAALAGSPPLAVLPDAHGAAPMPDIAARVTRTLGLEA